MKAFEDCRILMQSGRADLEACLALYPHLREELEPLLRAAQQAARAEHIHPSAEFKQRGRLALQSHMHAHPHKKRRPRTSRFGLGQMRVTFSVLTIALALVTTGTVLAQSAVPGRFLYGWKLTTERLWVALTGETNENNLNLSERRLNELLIVRGNQDLESQAFEAYFTALGEVLKNLEADPDLGQQIYENLLQEQHTLRQAGIEVPELNDAILQIPAPEQRDAQDEGHGVLPDANLTNGTKSLSTTETPLPPGP